MVRCPHVVRSGTLHRVALNVLFAKTCQFIILFLVKILKLKIFYFEILHLIHFRNRFLPLNCGLVIEAALPQIYIHIILGSVYCEFYICTRKPEKMTHLIKAHGTEFVYFSCVVGTGDRSACVDVRPQPRSLFEHFWVLLILKKCIESSVNMIICH